MRKKQITGNVSVMFFKHRKSAAFKVVCHLMQPFSPCGGRSGPHILEPHILEPHTLEPHTLEPHTLEPHTLEPL